MSLNIFKKMIMVSSFAVIAISAIAQDREDGNSLASTGLHVNASELRTVSDAQEDGNSGLYGVICDQLVTQPCRGLLNTAHSFIDFARQHPYTTLLAITVYTLPFVAASTEWYARYVCASSSSMLWGSPTYDQPYTVLPYTSSMYSECTGTTLIAGTHGFSTRAECETDAGLNWRGPSERGVWGNYQNPACTGQNQYALCNFTIPWGSGGDYYAIKFTPFCSQ
jgi:hypothetical protein